jgi:predicted nuclease of restriction endonuclease-like RecB superfamily
MLLPFDGISYRVDQAGLIHPRWLGEEDEAFVEAVIETIAAFDGLTVHEVEVLAETQLPELARGKNASSRVAEAIWALERRRWEAEVDAPVEPAAVRAIVFDSAATMPRDEALAQAALELGLTTSMVAASLFADRVSRRRLRAPVRRAEPADLVTRYNLAVVQTLLGRAMRVEATTSGEPQTIARAAKRDGLIVQMAPHADGTLSLSLTGPLSLVRDTAKYGRSIARFVPALVAAPAWSLRARIHLGTRNAELMLDHRSPVSLRGGSVSSATMQLARRTAKALREAGVRVDLHPPALRAGGSLVVPDFALEWGADRKVYVDVLPFATDEHLAAKLEAIGALDVPMIVCVDDRCVGSVESPAIVPYHKAIDAWTLLAAARTAAATRDAA